METPTLRLTLPEHAKEVLPKRIPEAAAWAALVSPGSLTETSLRTPELMPVGYSERIWLSDKPHGLPREWMEHVSRERAKAIGARALRLPSLASALESGFILAHDAGICMLDELPANESPFFDKLDNTAWDTWPLVVDHESETQGPLWLSWIDRRHAAKVMPPPG